jgi:hypothetical protein
MQTFVLIFHQGSPLPTAEERQQITRDVADWAEKLNAEGHKLDPRILTPEGAVRAEGDTSSLSREWPITALLILEAKHLADAARIGESHPALRNRTAVEVRQWNPPVRSVAR